MKTSSESRRESSTGYACGPNHPSRGQHTTPGSAALMQVLFMLCATLLCASSASGQTATWIGGNTNGSWSNTNNWSPKGVPLNGTGTNYTVVVPDSTSLRFDVVGGGAIDALSFGVGSRLLVTNGQPLSVNGTAVLKGQIQASGAGSGFQAPADTVVLSSTPQFLATNGAAMAVGGSTYSCDRAIGSATLLAAVGTNSSVDLHGVSSMVLNGSGNPTYSIVARSNGVVDLSALANLTGPGSGGMLEMTVDSGGQLKLDSARQLSQNLRFNLGVPVFQLPQAVSMDSVTINQTTSGELDATNLTRLTSSTINTSTNGLFNLPSLASIATSTISVSTGGVFNVPGLNTITNSSVSLSPGAVFSAPALWSLHTVPVMLTGSGSFQAPNLASYVNSTLSISPGRDFQMGTLTNIYSSTISVRGGLGFQIGALAYEMPPWPAWDSSATPPQSLFLADGSGSLLDLSSLKSVRVSGVGKAWWASGAWHYEGVNYTITATNQGVVNLSGLEIAYGADPNNYNGNDWLAFQLSSGGTIQLPNLKRVTGRTRFDLQVPQFGIPMLQSVDHTLFNLQDGGRIDLLSLTNFDMGWITFGFNSTFNAPQLRTFVNSDLNLVPGQILTTPPFTNIYASRLSVSSGVSLVVGAPGYDCPADWQVSPTLFSADGAGSLLDLSSMQTLVTHGGNGGAWVYSVTANNSGTVDLSGLRSAVGPDPASYFGDDWLQFSLQNSGTIRLTNLQQVSGRTRFVLGVGTRLDLPNLTRLANGASINFGPGAVFNAPSLVELVNSTVSIATPGSFIVPALTNVSSASLSVSGGSVLHIAADHYEVPPTEAWDSSTSIRTPSTLFSADGPGSLMDVSALKWIRVYGVGKAWYYGGAWHYEGWNYSVSSANQGVVDLSQLGDIYGADPNNYNGVDWLSFTALSGGTIRFGTASVYQRTRFSTTDPNSMLDFAGLYLRAPATLNLGPATLMRMRGDLLFENTDTNALTADLATLVMDGTVPQRLEVGGRDVGPASAFMQGNFGFGQLVAGRTNQQSIVRLVDTLNNGYRSPSGGAEALYLYGLGGQGLRLFSGSRFLLGYLNCYALVSGLNINLQTLIPAGSNSVAFDGGFIGNVGGPSITNMTPGVAVVPAVSSVDIAFNIPIQAASFTTADVQIAGPGGSITPTGVAPLSGTTWRISFPSQSADGTYTVRVGPNINELAGNFLGMDQNGDGRSGDGTNDVFTGTFVIDGTPPVLLAAYALQGGTRVGLTFNEPVTAAFATNATNYTVNGATPAQAVLLANGFMVSLTVAPLLGDSFAMVVSNQTDLLGNRTNQSLAGNILAMQSGVLGTGTDPLEPGSTTPFSNATFQELAGGTSIGGTADHGRFTYEPRAGDFDIRLRLESLTKVGSSTEAGLMARETTNANSRCVYANVEYGTSFNRHIAGFRQPAGGTFGYWPNGSFTNPVAVPNAWMRLRREGDIFRAFCGTNGQDWIEYARYTNSLPQSLLVGMASSAVNNGAGQFTTAAYRDYSDITPYIVTQPQSQAVASGVPVVFGVNVRGLPTLAYQWYFNGVPVSGGNSSLLTLSSVAVTNAGDYRCVVTNSYGSATSQVATLVVDGVGTGGFEADLMPQPNGDNATTISDWVKTGRLVAGLDTVLNSSEFQRVDCAPRMTLTNLTLGDGRLTVADWTQAGRYAAGLDPLTPAGGPTQPALGQPAKRLDSSGRTLTVASPTAWQGYQIEVPVLLNGAQGNENALGFSLAFDPARLAYQGVTLGKNAAGASLVPNAVHAPDGQLGLALALPANQTLGSGTLEIARVRFTAVGATGLAGLQLTGAPVVCELVDTVANALGMQLISGTVQVVSAPGFTSVQLLSGGGLQLMLAGPEGQTCQLQASTNLTDWVTLSTNVLGSAPLPLVDQTAPSGKCRFYRLAPVQ